MILWKQGSMMMTVAVLYRGVSASDWPTWSADQWPIGGRQKQFVICTRELSFWAVTGAVDTIYIQYLQLTVGCQDQPARDTAPVWTNYNTRGPRCPDTATDNLVIMLRCFNFDIDTRSIYLHNIIREGLLLQAHFRHYYKVWTVNMLYPPHKTSRQLRFLLTVSARS